MVSSCIMQYIFSWLFFIVFLPVAEHVLVQDTLETSSTNQNLSLQAYTQIVTDTNAVLLPEDAATLLTQQGEKATSPYFLDEKTVYWARATFRNSTKAAQNWNVQIGNIDSVSVFLYSSKQTIAPFAVGRMIPLRNPSSQMGTWDRVQFPLTLLPEEEVTLLLRLHNFSKMPGQLNLVLMPREHWEQQLRSINLIQGCFQGFMFMMTLLGLMFYLYTRIPAYLYYTMHAFAFGLTYLTVYGYTRFITGNFAVDYFFWALFSQSAAIFFMQFIRLMLRVRSISRNLDNVLIILIALRVLIILLTFYNTLATLNLHIVQQAILLTDTISSLLGITIIAFLMAKGNIFAKYVLIGSACLVVGVGLAVLAGIGVFTIPPAYFTQLGIAGQCIVLALGLANEIRGRVQGEVQAKQALIALKEQANRVLEQKVKERTEALQRANESITHQNEELIQSQEEIARQRDYITQKNKELQLTIERIGSSMKAAKTIQKAILPSERFMKMLFRSYFVVSLPKDVVSGDFFWVAQMDDGKVILVVADCTGHGVPGALMTMISHILLDKVVKLWKITEPPKIFEVLHREISQVLQQKETGDQNGMDAAIICFEPQQEGMRKATFCGARTNGYVVSHQHKTLKVLKGSRKSVGGKQDPAKEFVAKSFMLAPKDFVYLGSDGLVDQNNDLKRRFGKQNLEKLLLANHHLPAQTQGEAIVQNLKQHMGKAIQRDDILWVGVQI